MPNNPIYKFITSVCDRGFGGWGKGEAGEAAGDPCQSPTGCGFRVTMQAPVL